MLKSFYFNSMFTEMLFIGFYKSLLRIKVHAMFIIFVGMYIIIRTAGVF